MQHQTFTCPVCGFDQLDTAPYAHMPPLTEVHKFSPPYENIWGKASYDVCDCCGFEYGSDDNSFTPKDSFSFSEYLKFWVQEENCMWFDPGKKPQNWSLTRQLEKAGLPVPDYVTDK